MQTIEDGTVKFLLPQEEAEFREFLLNEFSTEKWNQLTTTSPIVFRLKSLPYDDYPQTLAEAFERGISITECIARQWS